MKINKKSEHLPQAEFMGYSSITLGSSLGTFHLSNEPLTAKIE
jgi:hypothetical protein